MRKLRYIIGAAVAVYLVALCAAWKVATDHAYEKTEKLLTQSEKVFIDSNGDGVDAVLMHVAAEVMRDLGPNPGIVPQARMRELMDHYMVDEINLIGTNGICFASTVDAIIGHDFRADPETEAFLKLLDGEKWIAQPFRKGTVNIDDYRKYLGLPYKGVGFIQLGMNFSRVIAALFYMDHQELHRWKIGRTGHYDFYDLNGDGQCDYSHRDEVDGKVSIGEEDGVQVYIRPFTYAGYRFLSVMSEREYFGERNLNFSLLAPVLAAVVLFFGWLVFSMTRASELERRHREAEDAVRRRDLEMAQTIQLSSLPSPDILRNRVLSFSLSAFTHPAKEVGGDFYDFYRLDRTRMAVIIADVSGKGIPAAMFMMRARNEIYNALCTKHDLAAAVAKANGKLCGHNDAEMFVTAWIGVINIETGEMTYVNAGHNRPFIRRADGSVEKVSGKGGRFLGLFPDAPYRTDSFTLAKGDSFFMFTDGITEAMNRSGAVFGEKRLIESLAAAEADPEKMIAAVNGEVVKFADGAEQSDDLTSLALVWLGASGQHTGADS